MAMRFWLVLLAGLAAVHGTDQGISAGESRAAVMRVSDIHPRMKETGRPVEQVHITATDRVMVNFVTQFQQASIVELRPATCAEIDPVGRVQLESVCADTDVEKKKHHKKKHPDNKWRTAQGVAQRYSSLNHYTPTDAQGRPVKDKAWWGKYAEPKDWYSSGYCHAVELKDLEPGVLYVYRIPPITETVYYFRAPKAVSGAAPTRIGIMGDMGQSNNSVTTVDGMWEQLKKNPLGVDQVLLLGDLAYSNGFGPLWDSFGRMVEPLFAHVPTAVVGGDHEFEFGESWVGLRARWPMPAPEGKGGADGLTSPLYYSYETGPVHVLALLSYMDASKDSPLYRFVESDLASIDRSKTPWVVAFMHVPWYTSSAQHTMAEGAYMRESLEPLLIAAGVDLVLAGHVHAYERTLHVGRGGLMDQCAGGYVHITAGAGGSLQGSHPFEEPPPAWSAYREAGLYGYGILQVESATRAVWEWWRDDAATTWRPAEMVVLERGGECDLQEEDEDEVEVEVAVAVDGQLDLSLDVHVDVQERVVT